MNEAGGLPTRNFSSGRFEGAAEISGEAIFEGNKERLGKELYNHACSPGCIIQCSNTWHAADGTEIASCVEYESAWALGANCGIDDLDDVAELVKWCNAYGLDTIEAGTTIAVAMEAGVAEFGDGKKAIELMHEMGKGTPLGRILGSGTNVTAQVFGVVHNPTVKGQSMPAYEPRAVKGIGVTYATTTMGADHTAGYTIAPEIAGVGGSADPLSPEGKADLSRAFQATTALIDSTGHCLFIAFAILDIASGYEGMVEELNGVLGTSYTVDDVVELGSEILRKERAFNEAAGFTKAHDRLPEFMKLRAASAAQHRVRCAGCRTGRRVRQALGNDQDQSYRQSLDLRLCLSFHSRKQNAQACPRSRWLPEMARTRTSQSFQRARNAGSIVRGSADPAAPTATCARRAICESKTKGAGAEPFLRRLLVGPGHHSLSVRCAMKVYAKLFATLVSMAPDSIRESYPQGIRAGDPLDVELPEGSTLADLVDHLALPREKVRVIFVNGRARQLDYHLVPGDEVALFPPIGGG